MGFCGSCPAFGVAVVDPYPSHTSHTKSCTAGVSVRAVVFLVQLVPLVQPLPWPVWPVLPVHLHRRWLLAVGVQVLPLQFLLSSVVGRHRHCRCSQPVVAFLLPVLLLQLRVQVACPCLLVVAVRG